ncbi:MAG: sigma 54-interacting transcriptional regulator [Planctomycetes bacterium]|nr:sigma 54-interacting transcriptional regulator [Planctomycetota bacterium]
MNPILLLEEDSGDALVLKSRLAAHDYEVRLAEAGTRALALAREQPVRAILVSARLKRGLDTVETIRRLRAVPELNLVPILVYNQENGVPENCVRIFEAGANALILGDELPTLEHELLLALRMSARVLELTDALRILHEKPRVPGTDRARGEADAGRGETAEHQGALRELALGRPDGMLVVDGQGTVLHADRGACELLGSRPEGRHLGSLVPGCGLEAFVRDAQIETREGFRFDLPARKGRGQRALSATVVPLVAQQGTSDLPRKVVIFQDSLRRRLAAEALRTQEPTIPRAELGPLLEAAREVYRPGALSGSSPLMRELREAVARAIACREPVLILGEDGTGKERVARTLHYSGATTGAFLHARCASISAESLEAELFGSARNPGRGQLGERPGLLHLAQDGLLYLDEVTALPLAVQERVIEFLKTSSATRVGSPRPERLEVRIVASTARELTALSASGAFLPELAERLAANVLTLPSLAARREDLAELLAAMLERYGSERGILEISPEALRVLHEYAWPGNVGELEDCLERACASAGKRSRDSTLRIEDLPHELQQLAEDLPPRDLVPMRRADSERVEGTHTAGTGLRATEPRGVINVPSYRELRPWDITDEDPVSLDLYEKKALLRALSVVNGDKLKAAKLLKLGKSTMYRKLKRFGIP